jgi:DNA repair protein RadC
MFSDKCERAIKRALKLIEEESRKLEMDSSITSSCMAKNFLKLKLAGIEEEHFAVMFLNSQNKLIKYEVLFKGTINASRVHPRVIVKKALEYNALSLILAHNHPSGHSEPSSEDISLTKRLQNVCNLVDVKILDHIVVGKTAYSMKDNMDI